MLLVIVNNRKKTGTDCVMFNNTICALQYERAPQNGDSHKSISQVFNRLCDYIIGYLKR